MIVGENVLAICVNCDHNTRGVCPGRSDCWSSDLAANKNKIQKDKIT